MPRHAVLLILISALAIGSPVGARAQATTAAIIGTVQDETKAVLPGVAVALKNVDTGLTRTTVTDQRGAYRAPNLAVGSYEVTATLDGFKTAVRTGITLTVGQEAVVDMVLRVGEMNEKVVVTGEAPLIQTTTSATASTVDAVSMRALPLNARDFAQLATYQSGVNPIPTAGGGGHVNPAARITVAGAQMASNRFNLDGTDINDRFNQTPGSVAGVMLGVEAVREFSIQTSSYKAEHGAAGGAVINLVTRSGTNDLAGSVLYFHRNKILDATNFFAREQPPFRRHQFGGALGGPIIRGRTFFFGNYEGLRERLGLVSIANVPNELARQGFLPARTGALRFIGPVSPVIKPVLDLYPLPNGQDRGNGIAELVSTGTQPLREDYGTFRVDHQLGGAHSLFARYTVSDADFLNPFGGSSIPGFPLKRTSRNQYATIEGNSVLSRSIVNTLRLGFARAKGDAFGTERHAPIVLIPGRQNASISPGSGVSSIGDSTTTPSGTETNAFDLYNDLTVSRGAHTIKFGGNVKYRQTNVNVDFRAAGSYNWASLEDFLLNRPARQFLGTTPESSARRYYRTKLLGFYVQDDIKATPRLTLNLGVRYEVQLMPVEKFGRNSFVEDVRTSTQPSTDKRLYEKNPGLLNFAPRVGFAWDLTGKGTTALRGGFGMFHDHIESNLFADAMNAAPFVIMARVLNPVFPTTFQGARFEIQTRQMARRIETPYMMRWNLNLQRQIVRDLVAEVGYTGSRGVNLPYAIDLNPYTPASFVSPGMPFYQSGIQPSRLNPRLGEVRSRETGAHSSYHGLDVALRRRFSGGFQVTAAYGFGKAIDEASGAVGADFVGTSRFQVPNPCDVRYSRGPANFDMRHKFSFTSVVELPFGSDRRFALRGFAGALLGGWDLTAMLMVTSGNPRTVTAGGDIAPGVTVLSHLRPDLNPGYSANPITPGNPNQYIDPAAFVPPAPGQFGNLGANTVYGPGLATLDLGITRKVSLQAATLELRWEVFNALNRANFGLPSTTAFSRRGNAIIPAAGFGRITRTVTPARQMQAAVKILF